MENNNGTLNSGKEVTLKRTMGFWSLVLFGVVFMGPSIILTIFGYEQTTTRGHTVITMAFASVVALISCLSYAKMVEVFPRAGSSYTYTTKSINPKLGFMAGWVMLIDYVIAPMFMLCIVALYMNRMYPFLPWQAWLLIVGAVVMVMNILGLKAAKAFNISAGLVQVGLAVLLSVLGVVFVQYHGTALGYTGVIYNSETFSMSSMMVASAVAVMSFMGFDGISTIAEETTVSPKMVGRAIVVAVVIQGCCLVGVGYVCSLLMPDYTQIENPDTVAVDLYTKVGGSLFSTIALTVKQFLVIMAACNVTTAASRLLYAMGRDGVLPKKFFGYLNPKYRTPTRPIFLVIIICVVGALLCDWSLIAEVVSFGGLFGFACVNLSVVSYFWIKKNDRTNPLRHLILPLIGFATVLFTVFNASIPCKILGVSWTAIGVIYLLISYKKSKKFKDAIDSGSMM
jgi:amino acid transporter